MCALHSKVKIILQSMMYTFIKGRHDLTLVHQLKKVTHRYIEDKNVCQS